MTSKNNAVPTLTAKGWITGQDFSDRIDVVLAYAFVSDHSQSVSHANKVFSVQWYLSKHAKNPIVLKSELEVQFNLLFKRHFDQSSIRIDVVENENGILDLIMRGGVTQDNKTPIFNRHPTLVKGASSNSAALISAEARSRATQHPKLGERYLLENMSRKIQKLEIDMDSVRQFDKMLAYFGEPTLFNKSTPLTPPPGMQPTETFDDDDFEEA